MRFKSIKLTNYIGIYNGMGLSELSIDFSKCKHKTIIIRGDNGSGKSTLFNALSPLPDSNDQFIPSFHASKEIELVDNGTLYCLKFLHNVKYNGERDVTKAYIHKIINGVPVDMNPNGNVTSFKDILYDEFKLDANFVTLSQLSTDDKGLADKKPAERKRFVNAIIETLSVYNNIHKTLTKRSSVFKSMINSIASKLDNIGDENRLSSTLLSLEQRIASLEEAKNACIEQRATARSIMSIKDPDNGIVRRYNETLQNIDNSTTEHNNLTKTIRGLLAKYNLDNNEDVFGILETLSARKITLSSDIQIIKNNMSSMLADREEDAKKLQAKVQRLESLQDTSNLSSIKEAIKQYKEKIAYCEAIFSKIGIVDALKISKDEYVIGLNTLKEIKEIVDVFKSQVEYATMEEALEKYISSDSYPDTEQTKLYLAEANNTLSLLKSELIEWESIRQIASKLNMRHPECSIDGCDFIKDAVLASNKEPNKNIKLVESQIASLNPVIKQLEIHLQNEIKLVDCINYMKTIIRAINSHKSILSKFPNNELCSNPIAFFKVFLSGESFDFINTLYSYMDYSNLFEEYKIYKDGLLSFTNDLKLYQSRNEIVTEIATDITELNQRLNDVSERLEIHGESLRKMEIELMAVTEKEASISSMVNMAERHRDLTGLIKDLESQKLAMSDDISTINNSISIIDSMNKEEVSINQELQRSLAERDKMKHAIQLICDYRNELEVYQTKYKMIETIKYYSSPNTGIQLVFMELYMSKIISLANELLALLFDGRFVIQPFVISDSEFRIPCLGNGYVNDDISSLSSGEKAMISMIISFSLLYQSSTKYNILKLDEIDGPLDNVNRLQFLLVLEKLIEILESEQCIMISHNSEIDTTNADLIILRTSSGEDFNTGNVIYRFAS